MSIVVLSVVRSIQQCCNLSPGSVCGSDVFTEAIRVGTRMHFHAVENRKATPGALAHLGDERMGSYRVKFSAMIPVGQSMQFSARVPAGQWVYMQTCI